MKDLLQRFDSMLTPQSTVKSATPRSIQLGTIDAAAVKKYVQASIKFAMLLDAVMNVGYDIVSVF